MNPQQSHRKLCLGGFPHHPSNPRWASRLQRRSLTAVAPLDPLPQQYYNDNHGTVDWSNSFRTKGMCHVNIWENVVREAHMLNEVSIHHIPGLHNPADLFTKEFKSDSTFWTLHNLTLFYPSSFKTD
jgi:hypothetical protein